MVKQHEIVEKEGESIVTFLPSMHVVLVCTCTEPYARAFSSLYVVHVYIFILRIRHNTKIEATNLGAGKLV
jgi:hypothetical protein